MFNTPVYPHVSPDEDPHSDITELNEEEENDDDDRSDTEDDTVVDSVDTLPNDIKLGCVGGVTG
jgi:hypothetical protein